jgi:SAM-dependent methyltransferase
MTSEETVKHIRSIAQYADLVKQTYVEEDLVLNVERFKKDIEFSETLKIVKQYAPNALRILDIGSGNGVSVLAFALMGYEVTSVEPDPSNTIGAGAIRELVNHYNLQSKVEVHEKFAEEIGFKDEMFDIVYVRQTMHHAYDLPKFVAECARVLKKNGLFLTIRDHVIFDKADKEDFFKNHPLHKFNNNENAFLSDEYKAAMTGAGLTIKKEIKFFDSPINYYPETEINIENWKKRILASRKHSLKNKIGPLANISFVEKMYQNYLLNKLGYVLDERPISGRMYSYICIK